MRTQKSLKTNGLGSLLIIGVIWFASSACNDITRPPDVVPEPPCPLANPEDPCWDEERETSIAPTSPEPSSAG